MHKLALIANCKIFHSYVLLRSAAEFASDHTMWEIWALFSSPSVQSLSVARWSERLMTSWLIIPVVAIDYIDNSISTLDRPSWSRRLKSESKEIEMPGWERDEVSTKIVNESNKKKVNFFVVYNFLCCALLINSQHFRSFFFFIRSIPSHHSAFSRAFKLSIFFLH